jgi:hypothetical protein
VEHGGGSCGRAVVALLVDLRSAGKTESCQWLPVAVLGDDLSSLVG